MFVSGKKERKNLMSEQPANELSVRNQPRSGWLFWSTRDILLVAAIAVVFGLILAVLMYPYQITALLSPIIAWAWIGLYILPSFFIAYALRRVGAAALIALLYSLVLLPFSPFGPLVLLTGAMYAVGGEVAVALGTRYRSFSLLSMILTGALGGVVLLAVYWVFYPASFALALPLLIGVIAVTILSSTVSAVVAKLLVEAVARTGVLAGTALKSKDVQEV
jgi:energy-coupling factor transport system substrate-specific component